MPIEIEVVSTEIIPPSSPTPNDVSNYKFSFLDQLTAPVFMPHTRFYEANGSLTKSEISSHLKKTLSKTLSLYYPLAGRIVDNTHVNCNDDQGITYVEAQADCKLLDFMNGPNIEHELVKFLPQNIEDVTDVCIIVQTTFFSCGGMSIGVANSHKICDGWSVSLFVNSWAAISRGDDDHIQSPIFDGATLFPPRDLGGYDPRCWITMNEEDLVTKRFMFTSSKINELRDIFTNKTRATRFEALTMMAMTPLFDGEEGSYNGVGVVEKMREAINNIDGDYINKLRDGTQTLKSMNDRVNNFISGELLTFVFSSIYRIPLYEADFGWGKPIWIGLTGISQKHRVAFIDTVFEGGIEAWNTFKSKDMAKFEADQDLLAYATT